MRLACGTNTCLLDLLEGLPVVLLLRFVVLVEKRTLLFSVRAFDVIDALRNNAQTLLQLLLVLLQLRDLDRDEVLRIVRLQFLENN